MYNRDGSIRPYAGKSCAPPPTLVFDWNAELNAGRNNKAMNNSSMHAAGLSSELGRFEHDAIRSRPGSTVRVAANKGTLNFNENEVGDLPSARAISDAKKNSLYNSTVFTAGTEACGPTKHVSNEKLQEVAGHDIFKDDLNVKHRTLLGGVRAPGGESSLTMADLA